MNKRPPDGLLPCIFVSIIIIVLFFILLFQLDKDEVARRQKATLTPLTVSVEAPVATPVPLTPVATPTPTPQIQESTAVIYVITFYPPTGEPIAWEVQSISYERDGSTVMFKPFGSNKAVRIVGSFTVIQK